MKKLIISLLAVSTLTVISSHAQTQIPGGNVSGVWNLAGSPYEVLGDISIQATDSLIIEPGVWVIF